MGHEIIQAYIEHVLPVLEKFQAGKCGSATCLHISIGLRIMRCKRAYMGSEFLLSVKIKHILCFHYILIYLKLV